MDLTIWIELVLFVLLLGLSAFFSSSETSLFSLSSVQLERMRRTGSPRISVIDRMLSEPRRLIVTILIGNEFVNVAASVISASIVIELLGAENKYVNLFIMVPILLLFGEITPKTLAIRNNEAFASFQCGPIEGFARLITPIRWLVRHVADFFITLLVGSGRSKGNIITEDMVRTLADEAVGEGTLDVSEARFINQVFDFGDKTLEDLLTPRADIVFISVDTPMEQVLEEVRKALQSRLPVYSEHRDTIVGILHARDLLRFDFSRTDIGLRGILRKAHFVPESKPAAQQFNDFREQQRSFALTVDEYGGVTGLVTMEDLLECIFGDIPSPFGVEKNHHIEALAEDKWSVNGALSVADFNRNFDANLAEDQAETIGGLVLLAFGELPVNGASTDINEFTFTVSTVEGNRITQLAVAVPNSGTAPEDNDDGAQTSAGAED